MFGHVPGEQETKELLVQYQRALKGEKAALREEVGGFQRHMIQRQINDIEFTIRLLKMRQAELQRSKRKNPRSTKRVLSVRSLVARALS